MRIPALLAAAAAVVVLTACAPSAPVVETETVGADAPTTPVPTSVVVAEPADEAGDASIVRDDVVVTQPASTPTASPSAAPTDGVWDDVSPAEPTVWAEDLSSLFVTADDVAAVEWVDAFQQQRSSPWVTAWAPASTELFSLRWSLDSAAGSGQACSPLFAEAAQIPVVAAYSTGLQTPDYALDYVYELSLTRMQSAADAQRMTDLYAQGSALCPLASSLPTDVVVTGRSPDVPGGAAFQYYVGHTAWETQAVAVGDLLVELRYIQEVTYLGSPPVLQAQLAALGA
ncbi:hypothetical protein [Agrococcus jejuensis]|uniref:PknH-like extracellular domain-containing protein n=1 Tax=Agrococcus jejuensis TaxID=399736 RepID=A0A1G8GUP9_9MICO|nr:hypothetical protein [Agrococcus jejuensis]SDH98059.1 hypothetical protein SAMN04489720_3077 [Agrococcus jejuensis]